MSYFTKGFMYKCLFIFILALLVIFSTTTIVVNTLTKKTTFIPVLMYHNFTTDPTQVGSTTVKDTDFLEQMTILQEAGYTAVTQKQLIDFYTRKLPLPEKPIMITFDDGYISNYDIAYPILKKTGMKATIFMVVSQAGQTPGHLVHFDWDKAREMVKSKNIEIGSHTYNMHFQIPQGKNNIAALKFHKEHETQSDYENRIFNDLMASKNEIQKHLGFTPTFISYPYGIYDETIIRLSKKAGFKIGVTVKNGENNDFSDPMTLKRINVPGGESASKMLKSLIP